ncbi:MULTISPECIES: DUF4249 domain-containing protein [Flavobacterium]|uniref:DUF4249 domain-containing protein n=1 Tax=Flavobacterium TaxID=237 RepID=UPI001FCA7605|nr:MULTISPECIES: DUF4249 domain-containing protein [Flavobacterium]UOK42701.1 DUF4249 domain-containing protein [Flavobacterium enshiense]
MKIKYILKTIAVLLFFSSIISCTEPYQLETNTFDEAIVLEATITNELKKQQVKVSKTYHLEESGPTFETGAEVYIEDDLGNQYEFTEGDNVYESNVQFQAVPGRQYQLFVTTANGSEYVSTKETLTTPTEIESLSTTVVLKGGQTGVEIGVNSYDPSGTSKYYRYEYEETSQITAPKWNPFNTILLDQPRICGSIGGSIGIFLGFETIGFEPRPRDTRVCYITKKSDELFLTTTTAFNEDRVTNFPVRFIANTDYTIAERYSILVKQYVQSFEAYTFYKTLKDMSGSGSLLSPNQPGFFSGNIKSATNPKEKVIGFFEVASISSERIFFNFRDIFPNTHLPVYPYECTEYTFDSMNFGDGPYNEEYPCGSGGPGGALRADIRDDRRLHYKSAFPIFTMVIAPCGDCSSFASNVVPPFWQ